MSRFFVSAAEALGLFFGLVLALNLSVPMVVWLSLAILLVSAFVLFTGRKAPRIQSRAKALVIGGVAAVSLMASATIYLQERDERLAALRGTDPAAYLAELSHIDDDRWMEELHHLRPGAYAAEVERRAAEAKAEAETKRKRRCTDGKASEAYVMIQADVTRRLRSPSTVKFPWGLSAGTRHIGNCIYRVVSEFDAQNGFGAMVRGRFEGRIEYFPEAGSWRTVALTVDD